MKTYTISKRVSAQAKSELTRIIETHEKYKNSFFFTPSCSADNRRRNEKKFAESNPDVIFFKGEDKIEVKMDYQESCKNVYYRLTVMVNGEVKNIAVIKKLMAK